MAVCATKQAAIGIRFPGKNTRASRGLLFSLKIRCGQNFKNLFLKAVIINNTLIILYSGISYIILLDPYTSRLDGGKTTTNIIY